MNPQLKQLIYMRCSEDDLKSVRLILQSPETFDLNEHSYNDGTTLLHRACLDGNLALVQLLLHHEADIGVRDREANTSVHKASSKGFLRIVQLLLKAVTNEVRCETVENKTVMSAYHTGATAGSYDCRFCNEIFMNTANFRFQTALDLARESQHMDTVQFLVESGAGSGNLLSACHCLKFEEAQTIIENSATPHADVKITSVYGLTSLHYSTCSVQAVELLCANGADPTITNEDGNTPLHFLVAGEDSKEVIQKLVNQGANVNALNSQGKTPLHHACIRLQPCVIECLLHVGADGNVQDNSGATPLHYLVLYHPFGIEADAVDLLQKVMKNRTLKKITNEIRFKLWENLSLYQQNCLQDVRVKGYSKYLKNKQDQWDYLVCRGLTLNWDIMPNDTVNPFEADTEEHLDVIELLLRHANSTNVKDIFGRTALHIAVAIGHTQIVRYLVKKQKADVWAGDTFGTTGLHEAVSYGDSNIVRLLLRESEQSGFKVKLLNSRESYRGQTALHKAIEGDKADIIEELLKHNPDVDISDFTGNVPLHLAVEAGQTDLVRKLVSIGADTNVQNALGNTLPHVIASMSTSGELLNIANFLLGTPNAADVNEQNQVGRTALNFAVWNVGLNSRKNAAMVRLLCESGARVNIADDYGNTPLHFTDHMTVEVVELLVEKGADINVSNDRGMSPLHVACLTLNLSCVEKLLECGADCNALDALGATSLHYACRQQSRYSNSASCCHSMIRVLIQHGADCNVRTKVSRKTPLHLAAENDDLLPDTIRLLASHTNRFLVDALGNCVLHCLSEKYHDFMPSAVSSWSHNSTPRNYCGMTCLHASAKDGNSAWMKDEIPAHLSAIEDELGRTCLHVALACGHHLTDTFVDKMGLVNVTDFMRRNCFHHMCIAYSHNAPCSDTFLTLARNSSKLLNACDGHGHTPLFYAVMYQSRWFVDQLMLAGAETNLPKVADLDNVSDEDISASVIGSSHIVVKTLHPNEISKIGPTKDGNETQRAKVYKMWKTLQLSDPEESYKKILREKVTEFADKLMYRVGEIDPLFKSTPRLVGSSYEGTRADRTEDEFDFMIVLDSFQCLLDYSAKHDRFPMYIRLKRCHNRPEQTAYETYTDAACVVQPVLVKEKLYSLLIQACYSKDLWRNSPFEYLRTKVVNKLYSPAVAVKLLSNNLVDGKQRLRLFSFNHISIDFVPAVPTDWELQSDAVFERYIREHVPDTVDHRGFAVMKPHKYSVGNDADGYCPVTFIYLESEVIRQLPTVRVAYTVMKWLLFCRGVVDHEVGINKYALKTCVIQCVVEARFRQEALREVTEENLTHCLQVILQKLWTCAQEDSIRNVAMPDHYQPVWKFEPFARFTQAYVSRHGLLYTSGTNDPDLNPSSCRMTRRPSDMQSTNALPEKGKLLVRELRESYGSLQAICEMFAVSHTTQCDDKLERCESLVAESIQQQDLVRYTIKYDDYTHEFHVNEIARVFLTPSPHCITV